ncbi:hypothetical protein BDW60DRAFT_155148 [Aspergillus nidulans var. acristatus]
MTGLRALSSYARALQGLDYQTSFRSASLSRIPHIPSSFVIPPTYLYGILLSVHIVCLSHDRANSRDPYTRGHVLIHFRWIIPCFSLACLGGFAV